MADYRTKKRLGQHFLIDQTIIDRIVALAATPKPRQIVEIGPGQGVLSLPLAELDAPYWAIEFDRDLISHLTRLLSRFDRVKIVNCDILKFNPSSEGLDAFTLIGNLPYNITAPVIEWTVAHRNRIDRALFMVQKEVALRLASHPGSKDWSPLAIFTQLFFKIKIEFDVPFSAFQPPPKVTSSVVSLAPAEPPTITDFVAFEKVVRTAFTHRRKQLVNNLIPTVVSSARELHEILDSLGFERQTRAEQLTTAQFLQLTDEVRKRSLI